jgi:hypothetical protein
MRVAIESVMFTGAEPRRSRRKTPEQKGVDGGERFPDLLELGKLPRSSVLSRSDRTGCAAARCALAARFLRTSLFLCLLALPVYAGTVAGTVRDGTTNEPAAGVDIILFRLQGGMEVAATTKSDAQGRYSLQDAALGQAPMLLRAVYRGVNYHQPVTPGKTNVDITVYEPTDKLDAFSVADRAIILQPSSSGLSVGEIYDIENKTQPPKAYFRQNGSFEFSLPDGAHVSDVSASDASGMPVKQGTIDKGKNTEAIDYPFRPGDSGVRISYNLPYSGDHARLKFVSPYAAGRFAVFAPPGVQVTGDGLSPAGQEQGFTAYVRDAVAANSPVTVSISGTAPVPSSNRSDGGAGAGMGPDQGGDANANSRLDQGDGGAPSASVTTVPARLDGLKWIIAAGFAAIFALGFVFLWKRPQFLTAGAAIGSSSGTSADAVTGGPAKKVQAAKPAIGAPFVAMPAEHASAPTLAPSIAVEEAKRHVAGSLDELKDTLFRLELRKQAGTISDEDYGRERQRVEQLLRDLVRG